METRIPQPSHRPLTPPRSDIFDGHVPALLHGRQYLCGRATEILDQAGCFGEAVPLVFTRRDGKLSRT